jgi:hypothetical protein
MCFYYIYKRVKTVLIQKPSVSTTFYGMDPTMAEFKHVYELPKQYIYRGKHNLPSYGVREQGLPKHVTIIIKSITLIVLAKLIPNLSPYLHLCSSPACFIQAATSPTDPVIFTESRLVISNNQTYKHKN